MNVENQIAALADNTDQLKRHAVRIAADLESLEAEVATLVKHLTPQPRRRTYTVEK